MLTLTWWSVFLREKFSLLSLLLPIPWVHDAFSRKALLSLPEEILYEVFCWLDWTDIKAASLTCRKLRAITKTRLLWQARALDLSFSSGVPLLEGPIEDYTSEELERKVIGRLQTRQRWRELDSTRFHWRELGFDVWPPRDFHLLPGGRWLLDNAKGCVYVADLDAPEMTWNALIDARQYDEDGSEVDPLGGSAIWVDPSTPWLSLRLALHNRITAEEFDSSRVCIYQLNLTGRDPNTTWTAEQLVTLQAPGPCMKHNLQLDNAYVLEQCVYEVGNSVVSKLHVFQYSDVRLRRCLWDYDGLARIFPLPNDRIIIITQTHVEIFNLKPMGSDGLVLEPSHRLSFQQTPALSRVSRVYNTGHFSYIITSRLGSINAIQIPNDIAIQSSMRSFAIEVITTGSKSLELGLMIRLRSDYSMDCITYNLDSEIDQVESVHVGPFPEAQYLKMVACDEASGRLVFSRHRDYVLLHLW